MQKRAIGTAVLALCGISECLQAQPGTFIKTLMMDRERGLASAVKGKRRTVEKSHLLMVYPNAPGKAELDQLGARNVQVVQFVPERGLMASVPDGTVLEDIRLEWVGQLRPEQKVSPALVDSGLLSGSAADATEQLILVEFYSDVTRADMLAIVAEESLQLQGNPDLVSWQLLVRGTASRLAHLAEWDEVAYLFPVSRDLADGRPVEACGGALSDSGRIGQIVSKVSEGWDGMGRNAANIGYYFSSYTGRLTQEQVRGEVLRAMLEWAKQVKVSFAPAAAADSSRSINIMFSTNEHGDGYPFDGKGKTLAHTFYPAPPNPEPLAGDMHFDDDEPWQLGTNVDLYSVALHELGHALGLGHSDNPEAVMYPYYKRVSTLGSEDVSTIREMYATQDGTPVVTGPTTPITPVSALQLTIMQPASAAFSTEAGEMSISGTTTGGAAAGQISWANSRGGSGSAQGWRPFSIGQLALQMGENVITLTAVDSSQGRTTQQIRIIRESAPTPPASQLTVRILSPLAAGVYSSLQSMITISGIAGPDGRVARIQWVNARGSGGSVAGSSSWSTSPISLDPGLNHITVIASDSQGQSVSAVLDIQFTPPADTVAPALTMVYPAVSAMSVSQATITLMGTASDNVAVSEVDWMANGNRTGKAIGTTSWRIDDYPLLPGINSIMIRVFDTSGNMSWHSLTITRL